MSFLFFRKAKEISKGLMERTGNLVMITHFLHQMRSMSTLWALVHKNLMNRNLKSCISLKPLQNLRYRHPLRKRLSSVLSPSLATLVRTHRATSPLFQQQNLAPSSFLSPQLQKNNRPHLHLETKQHPTPAQSNRSESLSWRTRRKHSSSICRASAQTPTPRPLVDPPLAPLPLPLQEAPAHLNRRPWTGRKRRVTGVAAPPVTSGSRGTAAASGEKRCRADRPE